MNSAEDTKDCQHDEIGMDTCLKCGAHGESLTKATFDAIHADLVRWTCGHLGVMPNEAGVQEILADFNRAQRCDACHNKQCTCADPYAVRTAEGWTNRV